MEHGWSLKHIHRLICNSSTYRQQSDLENAVAEKVDPENVLLWKFPIRRLGAEVVRDRILSASGRLNPKSFGLPIFPPLPDGIEDRVKYDNSKWATQFGPEGRRRSIYIYQQRTLICRYYKRLMPPSVMSPGRVAEPVQRHCRRWLCITGRWFRWKWNPLPNE